MNGAIHLILNGAHAGEDELEPSINYGDAPMYFVEGKCVGEA